MTGASCCAASGAKDEGLESERAPLFSGILPRDYERISAGARVKEFLRGEILYIEGDSVGQVLQITSGLVKITKFGSDGTEVILRLSGPGDVLGAPDPSCGQISGTTAQVFRPCRALVWDARAFKALLEPFPVLHRNMNRILGGHLLELEERFREIAAERVGPRVARQLVRLAEQIGRRANNAIEVDLSREELAQMTATTLFTVSRLLSAWETLGIVRPRREGVAVCDLEALRSMSEQNQPSVFTRTVGRRIPA
jgi:CRP-like cAMP-binding protein